MSRNTITEFSQFFVAGINYKKTDTRIRGSFAVNNDQYQSILDAARDHQIQDLFVLSTCNRSEIYGIAENPAQLADLLCAQTDGNPALFNEMAYVKSGMNAVRHLFDVAAGLDSQILGDYEIVGQLRVAVRFARERGFIFPLLDRTINQVLQSSKEIKTFTSLSDGTVSVAFAAVQYIRDHFPDIRNQRILLLGAGKMGTNACRNMVDYLGTTNITLINRTEEKALALAENLGLRSAGIEDLAAEVIAADVILVATHATEPLITTNMLSSVAGRKTIIDLSIPCNVDKQVGQLTRIRLIDVDSLSRIKDETLLLRAAEIPKAKDIIAAHMQELLEWQAMRRNVPVLKEVRTKLQEIHCSPWFEQSINPTPATPVTADQRIQRVLNGMASKMRRENQRGCQYIEAINEFIAAG